MASFHLLLYPIFGWLFLIAVHKLLLVRLLVVILIFLCLISIVIDPCSQQSSNVGSYKYRIDSQGIRISWFSLRVFITRFNSLFVRIACLWPKSTKKWFNVGCFVTIVSMPISLCFILYTFWHLLSPLLLRLISSGPTSTAPTYSPPALQPVVSVTFRLLCNP
jgi:hypothetical protein